MAEFIKIETRFINLDNIAHVLSFPSKETDKIERVEITFIQGASLILSGDDASEMIYKLQNKMYI